MTPSIVKRYAKAIYQLAKERDQCKELYSDLKKIDQLIDQSVDFDKFLMNPSITIKLRKVIINKIFKSNVNSLTYQFISFIDHKNRLNLLKYMFKAFDKLYLNDQGIVKVNITSSIRLNDSQALEVSQHLKNRLKKNIESQVHVDTSMLGGIKVQEGDTIYDYSLRTQLEEFKKNLIKA